MQPLFVDGARRTNSRFLKNMIFPPKKCFKPYSIVPFSTVSVSVSVRHRIQMTGDENGVGERVRSLILAYWLVVIGVFFKFGFEGRNGL